MTGVGPQLLLVTLLSSDRRALGVGQWHSVETAVGEGGFLPRLCTFLFVPSYGLMIHVKALLLFNWFGSKNECCENDELNSISFCQFFFLNFCTDLLVF